ncbi:MAG: HAD-IA family hydrolase [Rhodobacteraceae bacterium]|nr:HAD-IA family hydrolase [Paracoccaceae bacterium]
MTPQAVIFDIGNVLIEWQPERFYDRKIGSRARDRLFAEVDLHAMNDRIDCGGNWQKTVADQAEACPRHRDAIMMWHSHWLEMAGPRIDLSVCLLRTLRAGGVPVFALSNFGVETFAFAEAKYDFLAEFDRRYISGHLRMIKPWPEIYAHVEADSGIVPQGLLFVDDRAKNISAAAGRGWQTHLFRDAREFSKCLVKSGLLTADKVRQATRDAGNADAYCL